MKVSWGKPTILVADLDAAPFKWQKMPTPANGTTQLTTTEGTKNEALVEGGAAEDVRYDKSKFAMQYDIRALKGRVRPIRDNDGVVRHNYALVLQPADPGYPGILIQLSAVTVQNTYTAADGKMWRYKHDALQLEDETNQVKDGIVAIEYDSDGSVKKVTFTPEDEADKSYSGKTYDITSTEKFTSEASV